MSTDRATGATTKVWLLPAQGAIVGGDNLNYKFAGPTSAKDIDFPAVTGLEVAYEPGQWLVWAGCLMMVLGLFVAFYMVHMRLWVAAVPNASGQLVLWVGGAANKNKDRFEQKFEEVVNEIRTELKNTPAKARSAQTKKQEREPELAGGEVGERDNVDSSTSNATGNHDPKRRKRAAGSGRVGRSFSADFGAAECSQIRRRLVHAKVIFCMSH